MRPRLHTLLWFCLISVIYVVTRAGVLSRDLDVEEALFLQPGRTLLETGTYVMDWGVFTPHDPPNPFHKPPLTSLLLGPFSFLASDPVAGARLVPFLVGWFACVLPLLATGAVAPSFLILASPFFYRASGHLQTDPTVCLLGYSLVSWGMVRGPKDRLPAVMGAGLWILWLGKLETAVIASAAVVCWIALQEKGRGRLALSFARWSGAGIGCFVLLSWLLGRTAGLTILDSAGHVAGIVAAITSSSIAGHTGGTMSLLRLMWDFRVIHLLAVAGVAIVLLRAPRRRTEWALAAAALLPLAAYLAVGHVGDAFPRYFLVAFPPLLILLGLVTVKRTAISAALVAAAMVTMTPRTLAMMRAPDSGARDAAAAVRNLTQPGDLVCGPDNVAFYVPGRRWMIDSAFAPYPDSFPRTRTMAGGLRAIVLRRPVPEQGILRELADFLRRNGATSVRAGSFEVIARPPR